MSSTRFIYAFEEGDGENRQLLGGKGANLCEMTQIGLNVPPGFTITTAACLAYLEKKQRPAGLMDEVKRHMTALEKKTGKGFGDSRNPLLVSVRSGSAMSIGAKPLSSALVRSYRSSYLKNRFQQREWNAYLRQLRRSDPVLFSAA